MQSLRLTVYELLGYIAPGIVTMLALLVASWAAFWPDFRLPITGYSFGKGEWCVITFTAYSLGHFTQGLCNLYPRAEHAYSNNPDNAEIISDARLVLSRRCSTNLSSSTTEHLIRLSQAFMTQSGKTEDHDIFVYREGYYRGSSGAFLLLAISLLLRAMRTHTLFDVMGNTHSLGKPPLLASALFAACVAYVFYRRFVRFAHYRVQNLLSFICIPDPTDLGSEQVKLEANESMKEE